MNKSKISIGLFFNGYEPLHETKDPGQISLGLMDLNVNVELITMEKPELEHYDRIPIKFITKEEVCDTDFWANTPYNIVVAYTWLHRNYLPMISAMKNAGKKVVVKCDSDGNVVYPLVSMSFYLKHRWLGRILTSLPKSLRNLVFEFIYSVRIKYLVQHLELVDAAVIESPQAKTNLAYILTYWGKSDLINKIFVIPNSVANDVICSDIHSKKKQIISVGRWDDIQQKNTETMVRVLFEFSILRPDYDIVIIGPGKEIVEEFLLKISKNKATRNQNIYIIGKLPHQNVIDYLFGSQILFMPSNWESFGIAAAEAVCMGCSVVGTPLESLNFLTRSGFSGTLAPNFSGKALSGALLTDVQKWENGEYNPKEISEFWRKKLNRRMIAKSFLRVIIDLNK